MAMLPTLSRKGHHHARRLALRATNPRIWTALALLLVVAGCSTPPEEVYEAAYKATQAKDRDAFVMHVTARSTALLDELDRVKEEGNLEYLASPFRLLPEPAKDEPTRVRGNRAEVPVVRGRNQGSVMLLKEDGEWRIDLLSLPEFWKPLR